MKGMRPGIGRETFRAVRMLLFLLLLTMLMPMTVTIGTAALRSAWNISTFRFGRPLARAVRT